MTLTNEDLLALADRLEAPRYWLSTSDEGHEGENAAPVRAAAALREIVAERQTTQHGKEVMPNDEDNSHERPAVSPRLTAGAQAIRDKAPEDAGVTAARLEDIENNLWSLCNSIDDEDWIGKPKGLTAKVVGHFEKHHRMHVEMLERAARQVAAIRAMKGKPE